MAWRSVEIPRIPPRPEQVPLTAGYRRTPVMQIGADVYCDSRCIIHELQRRDPEPTLFPGGADGMAWGVSRWTEGHLFDDVAGIVLGHQIEALPPDFARDRIRLYFGAEADLAELAASVPARVAQVRAQFGWMNQRLATGRKFMLGDQPGLPDAVSYYLVWFLRGRWDKGPEFLSQFPALEVWEQRIQAIGYGRHEDMTAAEALDVARDAEPATEAIEDPGDPQGLAPGMMVGVTPGGDGGDPEVNGEIVAVSAETIAIAHENDRVGRICIHFPRVGYDVRVV